MKIDTSLYVKFLKEPFTMKKSLTSLFALAFALMFGMVHVASAEKHMAPAAPAANTDGAAAADANKEMTKAEKKEMKKEKKMKKKAAKKKKEMKEEMKEGVPAK
ncbi:MAG: hypothetical protein Q7J84_06640 [Sulfuricaulis sp.]|nr:hypothetical protein [Sulfuricaulis sp.]